MKRNKSTLLLTSVVILLPILAGLLLWNRLPERMATHWGVDGTANGWSGKAFAVFGLPLILLVVHWLCVALTARDKGNRAQSPKVLGMVLWITPVLSVFTGGLMYAAALGRDISVGTWSMLLMGVLFFVIGNYMPKSRQNRTVGIRVKWTLESEENWNATHRFGGRVWVLGGLLFCICAFLGDKAFLWSMLLVLPVLVLAPVIYAYSFCRKQRREGTVSVAAQAKHRPGKAAAVIAAALTVLILAGCAILCFTGDIAVAYGENAFTVEASYYQDLTVEYAAVERVELQEAVPAGQRRFGFGSPRLSMGQFQNEVYGDYTRYAYTGCETTVELQVGEEILVISGAEGESTRAIWRELAERCPQADVRP